MKMRIKNGCIELLGLYVVPGCQLIEIGIFDVYSPGNDASQISVVLMVCVCVRAHTETHIIKGMQSMSSIGIFIGDADK